MLKGPNKGKRLQFKNKCVLFCETLVKIYLYLLLCILLLASKNTIILKENQN